MPVPVSITHANGVGLKGANASELPTEGPFARLKAQAAQNQAASKVGDSTSEAVVERPPADQMDTSEPSTSSSSDIVIVRNLNFAYPGLGEVARLWWESTRALRAPRPVAWDTQHALASHPSTILCMNDPKRHV